MRKCICAFLVATIFFQVVLEAQALTVIQDNLSAVATSAQLQNKIHFPSVVRSQWLQKSSTQKPESVIYLIQDAHTSLLAQQQITQTLLHLRKQGALDGVLVEGAAGNLTDERFNSNPNLKTNAEFIDKLERQGYLHGAAAYYLARPDTLSRGMESPKFYRKNADLFRRVLRYQTQVQPIVSIFQVEWQRWLKNHVAEEYRDFFLSSASKHTESFNPDFFQQLIQMASDRLRIKWSILNQKEWPNLIRVQRMLQIQETIRMDSAREEWKRFKKNFSPELKTQMGKIDRCLISEKGDEIQESASFYRDFAAATVLEFSRRNKPILEYRSFFDWLALQAFKSEIQPEGLMDEMEKLESEIWNTWFKKQKDQHWINLGRLTVLLDKASRLELSRREVRQFRTGVKSGGFQKWILRFAPKQKDLLMNFCLRVIQFYDAAEQRESIFVKSIFEMIASLSKMNAKKIPQIAIVLGGYHKEGLLDALESKELEVALITPHLERIDQEVNYLGRMLQTSTLSFVPAAVQSPAVVRELDPTLAATVESDLIANGLVGEPKVAPVKKRQASTHFSLPRRLAHAWRAVVLFIVLLASPRISAQETQLAELDQLNQSTPQAVAVAPASKTHGLPTLIPTVSLATQAFDWNASVFGKEMLSSLLKQGPEARQVAISGLLQREMRRQYLGVGGSVRLPGGGSIEVLDAYNPLKHAVQPDAMYRTLESAVGFLNTLLSASARQEANEAYVGVGIKLGASSEVAGD